VKRRLATLALGAWLSALSAGCPDERAREHGRRADSVAPAEASAKGINLYSRAGLDGLAALLRQKGGGKPSLLMLDIAADRAIAQLEASARPGLIVQVVWRDGALGDEVPVELGGKGTLAQNLFPLSAVDLSVIPALLTAALARVDADNGKVSHVLIRRNLPHDESIGIRVYVESPLRSSHVDADVRGKLLEAGKYP
jgi:hypothetical protein